SSPQEAFGEHDEPQDGDDDEGPPPGFDPSAYLPRYADEPEDQPELQDDEWQPRRANAHLEGITRSVRKAIRAPSALPPGMRPPGQSAGISAPSKKKHRGNKPAAKFNLTPGIYQPAGDGMPNTAYPAARPKSGKRGGTGGSAGPGGARSGPKPNRSRRKSQRPLPKPE
ncbi:MAG: hypothetical protein EBW74_10450, partial [Betaproteobacteria bacterium]|nr:hypothetical protein [Betaproteobacteria bacterium]